jgi:Leucine-rich repeat (LRR) protein
MYKLLILSLMLICFNINAQDTFLSLAQANAIHPDSVYSLDLSKTKLKEIPSEIYKFKNLKRIDLSKNQLTDLPDGFAVFSSLEFLDLGKNKFTIFPLIITRLTNLKELVFNRNFINEVPNAIEYNTQLVKIDFWATPVNEFNEGIFKLQNLKVVDISEVEYSADFQKGLREKFGKVKVILDSPCNCIR